jgi:hypothetical protein
MQEWGECFVNVGPVQVKTEFITGMVIFLLTLKDEGKFFVSWAKIVGICGVK